MLLDAGVERAVRDDGAAGMVAVAARPASCPARSSTTWLLPPVTGVAWQLPHEAAL